MFYSVADGLTFLYFLFILFMVIITNLFAFLQKQPEIQIIPATKEIDLEQPLMEAVVINQFAVLIIGGLGNMLTLVAIPYVRMHYGPEFSLLQLNSVVLILHLSMADLLYCAVGFPHFIQVYFLRAGPADETTCFALGMMRNLVAYVDFNTIAMVACSVSRQSMCRECNGASLSHDTHDKIFGGKRVYLWCLAIWLVSIGTILPDITGTTGVYSWTASAYGCDTVCPVTGCVNVGPFISIIGNAFFIILFYVALIYRLLVSRRRFYGTGASELTKPLQAISMILFLLTLAYLAFLLPVVAVGWGLWTPWHSTSISNQIKAVLASVYWWMYGVNFVIYLTTSARIRLAYARFTRDIWRKLFKESRDDHTNMESSAFWIPLRKAKF